MSFTAAQIAEQIQGEVMGDGSILISGLNTADQAKPGDLTFAENRKYFDLAAKSGASAIVVEDDFPRGDKTLIRVKRARLAYAKILQFFIPEPEYPPGVHVTAVVDPTAHVDPSAHIGPHCVVEAGVQVGANSALISGVHVGAESVIGEKVRLHPRVTVYPKSRIGHRVCIHAGAVIGSDGYGYVFDGKEHLKIKQIGNVIIEDDVEIGANTTIDRGAVGSTIIGKGTRIDNLVQIAHNVVIGEHTLVVAQVGIAGSTRVGSYVTLAGQAGLAEHLRIGDNVTIGGRAGVMHDVPDGEKRFGLPAIPATQAKRLLVATRQLPELIKRVKQLEKQVNAQNTGQ